MRRGTSVAPADAMQPAHVVVAGAGLAGLSAAYELVRRGTAVTVVDARAYAGGRVRTIRDFSAGQHAELGGEFINSDHTEIRQLCDTFGLRLIRVLRHGFAHRFLARNGQYTVARTAPWTALADTLAPLVRRYQNVEGDVSADPIREMSTVSLGGWLRSVNAPQSVEGMAMALRGFFLADPDDISVLPVVEQIANGGSPAQAKVLRVEGGSDRLVDALMDATRARVLLGHMVRTVTQRPDGVTVVVTDPSGQTQHIEADDVVVTVPASSLRNIEIDPPLPDRQRHAIDRLAYGCATKVLLQTSERPWGARLARAFATEGSLGAFWDASEEQGSEASIIAFLAGGEAAARLRDQAREDAQALMAQLCWLRMDRVRVAAVKVADWTTDPWARGGYAFFDPGFDPAWRPLLARRAGRIVFAGEHTSRRWQGYMNGAVESGVRAARELLEELR
jgi:monoamine oxidase